MLLFAFGHVSDFPRALTPPNVENFPHSQPTSPSHFRAQDRWRFFIYRSQFSSELNLRTRFFSWLHTTAKLPASIIHERYLAWSVGCPVEFLDACAYSWAVGWSVGGVGHTAETQFRDANCRFILFNIPPRALYLDPYITIIIVWKKCYYYKMKIC